MSAYLWVAVAGGIVGLIRGLRKYKPKKPDLYLVKNDEEE
jgi:hypothetical protein